jgi:2-keto-4-pentenoate hydratase
MTWLANELSARGIGLAAGQLVTTGSATMSQPLSPGRSAIAIYGDLGEIRIAVAS